MKLGFALPHQGPVATRENMRRVAKEAEQLGYDTLWTNDRLLLPVNAKTPYTGSPDGKLNEEYKVHLEHLTCRARGLRAVRACCPDLIVRQRP